MAIQKKSLPQKINRIYKEDMTIDSDTFKLETTNFAKNLSFDDKKPIIVGVEHSHFFHTFDSNGRPMDKCNHVGGHTHEVKIEVDQNGDMVGTCSPAIVHKGFKEDFHTHQVTYVKSDRFKVRSMNEQAQQLIANLSKI